MTKKLKQFEDRTEHELLIAQTKLLQISAKRLEELKPIKNILTFFLIITVISIIGGIISIL